jgi:GT2 family glycosyltransferase
MEDASGGVCETHAPDVVSDVLDARRGILAGIPLAALPAEQLMKTHVHPAVSRLQSRLRDATEVATVREYGVVPKTPEVSVIVPLYGRVDFVEHQLAQFVRDDEMRAVELVYVLDSPELAGELQRRAPQLAALYSVPFRIVELAHSSGFAAANQIGVRHTSGRLLLFLNSDVLPQAPGWLSQMTDFYDRTDQIGALGPKLLYEDDSLQHAGMYFVLPDDTALAGLWANAHYYKGMHRRLPAACVNRPVPAVTGACMMMERDLYSESGGFSDQYVQGDHEDSDLCLRLTELGRQNWYLADVELYHLEGQSYPDELRSRAALYNRWLHTRMWDDTLRDG